MHIELVVIETTMSKSINIVPNSAPTKFMFCPVSVRALYLWQHAIRGGHPIIHLPPGSLPPLHYHLLPIHDGTHSASREL